MSHERYTLEQRTKVVGRNPEWFKFSGKEFRTPRLPEYVQIPLPEPLPQADIIFPLATAQPAPAIEFPVVNLSQKNGGDIHGL